tara:strand:+ start:13070 stop:13960 length:891 start_codon:yes stop_codon:yes gene_type:complete
MGYSTETMGLFLQMNFLGLFDDIKRVVDLGSQELHFSDRDIMSRPYREIIRRTVKDLGGPELTDEQLADLSNRGSAGNFFKYIGREYKALDADGWFDKPFDLNLDSAHDADRNAYCLCVNAGTTEHLMDQNNAFRIIHELTRPGGLMVHGLPFLGHVDHGFFNYNPNFFWALARFNSYDVLGMWINPAGTATLIPWSDGMGKYLNLSAEAGAGVSIWCLMKKEHDLEYCVPFQSGYETAQHPTNLARYNYAVDGRLMSGTEVYKVMQGQESIENVSGRVLFGELRRRIKRRLGLGS